MMYPSPLLVELRQQDLQTTRRHAAQARLVRQACAKALLIPRQTILQPRKAPWWAKISGIAQRMSGGVPSCCPAPACPGIPACVCVE
jgi:hypothetical protein